MTERSCQQCFEELDPHEPTRFCSDYCERRFNEELVRACEKACGELVDEARFALGYRTCLDCGELEAERETAAKRKRVGVAYNKGAYQYLTDRSMAKDLGRK